MPGFVHTERVRFGDLDALRHSKDVVFLRPLPDALRERLRDEAG